MSSLSAPPAVIATPVVLPVSKAVLWLVGTALIAFAVYYFIGVDQGAYSVFGNDMHIHEFVHDSRHFLGFPCH
ncbi:CbtB domain-containing protein [Streptacidiphilus cavernicola]|uniref:CbtB-domain containing protein n=1 Tax=Streptacidiphilus cavernicola TaxID=3342716 RepID=A0ABV6W3F1_9ACTN